MRNPAHRNVIKLRPQWRPPPAAFSVDCKLACLGYPIRTQGLRSRSALHLPSVSAATVFRPCTTEAEATAVVFRDLTGGLSVDRPLEVASSNPNGQMGQESPAQIIPLL